MIYFTSDLHLNHDKPFIYRARGFKDVLDMNDYIIDEISKLDFNDSLYILGDIIMGSNEDAFSLLRSIKCHVSFIRGNHDSEKRCKFFNSLDFDDLGYANMLYYKHRTFYLSHYPTIVNGVGSNRNIYNLYGHTHQTDKFYSDDPFMYNVGVDAHECKPVSIEEIIQDVHNKRRENI